VTLPGQFQLRRDVAGRLDRRLRRPPAAGQLPGAAYDVADGALPARGDRDKRNLHTEMAGSAMARTSTRCGRWVFTLYRSSEHIFVHSLDVDHAAAICLDPAHVDGIEPAREGGPRGGWH
jgi:hypothetical protein